MKPVTMLLCLVVMVGCSTLERLSAGERPPGYLDGPALPDSVVLIPPRPRPVRPPSGWTRRPAPPAWS